MSVHQGMGLPAGGRQNIYLAGKSLMKPRGTTGLLIELLLFSPFFLFLL